MKAYMKKNASFVNHFYYMVDILQDFRYTKPQILVNMKTGKEHKPWNKHLLNHHLLQRNSWPWSAL